MFYLEEYDLVILDGNTAGEGKENGQGETSRTMRFSLMEQMVARLALQILVMPSLQQTLSDFINIFNHFLTSATSISHVA